MTEEFINKSNQINENIYDYSNVNYVRGDVKIMCKNTENLNKRQVYI